MEKTDLVIALAGAAVLVVALTASAVFGGAGVGGTAFAVTFPESDEALDPASFSQTGSGEQTVAFDVAHRNVTRISFTASAAGPGGAAAPSITLIVTSPEGEEFTGEGTVEVPVAQAPGATTTRAASADAVPLPPANESAVGTWTVVVQLSSPAPLPVPYTGTVEATVTTYAANVAPDVPAGR